MSNLNRAQGTVARDSRRQPEPKTIWEKIKMAKTPMEAYFIMC